MENIVNTCENRQNVIKFEFINEKEIIMNSKDRAFLRGKANTMEAIFQIGKGGVSDNLIKQLVDALEARELIKITVLDNCDYDAKELGEIISEKTGSTLVQVVGKKITLYKKKKKDSKYNIDE